MMSSHQPLQSTPRRSHRLVNHNGCPAEASWDKSFVQMHLSPAHVHESYYKM